MKIAYKTNEIAALYFNEYDCKYTFNELDKRLFVQKAVKMFVERKGKEDAVKVLSEFQNMQTIATKERLNQFIEALNICEIEFANIISNTDCNIIFDD